MMNLKVNQRVKIAPKPILQVLLLLVKNHLPLRKFRYDAFSLSTVSTFCLPSESIQGFDPRVINEEEYWQFGSESDDKFSIENTPLESQIDSDEVQLPSASGQFFQMCRHKCLLLIHEGVEGFFVTHELGLFVNGPQAFTCYFPWSSVTRFSSNLVILSFLNSRNVIRPFQNVVQCDKDFRRPS